MTFDEDNRKLVIILDRLLVLTRFIWDTETAAGTGSNRIIRVLLELFFSPVYRGIFY